MSMQSHRQFYRIGYILNLSKEPGFIQPSLLTKSTELGVDLIRIDPNKPLTDQGPFDCVIHKLYGPDWSNQLLQFSSRNPNVPIIDSPESIERLHNRITMLEVVPHLKIDLESQRLGVPKQVSVLEMGVLMRDNAIEEMKLRFPVIAKPLLANGTEKAHTMCLIFDKEGLRSVTTPIVLQEFVNHGGVLFKVYVAGFNVKCAKRMSLPDISEEKLKSLKGSLTFSQISNLVDDHHKKSDNCYDEVNLERAEMPCERFVMELAGAMREALGLNLFNFDMLREASDRNSYVIVDINYFPGYAKLPGFESMLTNFFLQVLNKKSVEPQAIPKEKVNSGGF